MGVHGMISNFSIKFVDRPRLRRVAGDSHSAVHMLLILIGTKGQAL
jgi:hypothetical protein